MDAIDGSRRCNPSPAATVLLVRHQRPEAKKAVRDRLKIVGRTEAGSHAGHMVSELHGLVLNEIRVVQLDVAERRRRCEVASAILLRLAAYEGTWAEDEAA